MLEKLQIHSAIFMWVSFYNFSFSRECTALISLSCTSSTVRSCSLGHEVDNGDRDVSGFLLPW